MISIMSCTCSFMLRLVKRLFEGNDNNNDSTETVVWRWQFDCSEEWALDSITKFRCVVKIRSLHDKNSPTVCVGSLGCYTINLVLIKSYLMSFLYERFGLALKSARKGKDCKGLFTTIESRFGSRLFINFSKSSWDWLLERYNEITSHSLSLIFSKLIHSC